MKPPTLRMYQIRVSPKISMKKLLKKYTQEENSKECEEFLSMAIFLDEKNADAYEVLGVILGREERYKEAIELMNRLKDLDSSSVMAHTNLSIYYMKLGDLDRAEEEKADALVLTMKKNSQAKEITEEESEMKRREEMFKNVLEIDAEDSIANCGLGEIEFTRGNYIKSQGYFEIAVQSKYTHAYLGLVQVLKKLNKKKEAVEILNRGITQAASKGDSSLAKKMQALLHGF